MATLIELKKELEPYKNTLVIGNFNSVVRLEDVVEEPDDYYWVYDCRRGKVLASCVGGWVALKGFVPDKEYDDLVRVWNLNNVEKAV